MAEIQLLGLFRDVGQAASAIEKIRGLGVKDQQISVLSSTPLHHEILGRPKPRGHIGRTALFGAIAGLITAVALVAGTGLVYPLNQGNQSTVPIPPMLIIMFELAMLGTMWAAFFGMLAGNRFPRFRKLPYHPSITDDSIGVVVEIEANLGGEVEAIFKDHQAHQIEQETASQPVDVGMRRFWLGAAAGLILIVGIGGLFVYDVIRIPFGSQMIEQESIAPQEGPRLAAPAAAVPIQGALLAVQEEPVSAGSLQRGQVFFSINCELCHGATGVGDGPMKQYLKKQPADLTSAQIQNLADDDIYMVVMHGFGVMPSLAENLDPQDAWDVVHYLRTLKK